jgi:hypothetical protein
MGPKKETSKCVNSRRNSVDLNITKVSRSGDRVAITINGNRVVCLRDLSGFPSELRQG